MILVYGVYKIWELFQYPSIQENQRRCSQPIPPIGDNSQITIWGFEESGVYPGWKWGISDASPYVSRVEAYLRLIQKPYIKAETKGLMENPRRKVPFANIRGQMIDDSSAILFTLRHYFDVKIDDHLTEEQLVTGHLIRQMLFGSLYWVELHQNFETEIGRKRFRDGMQKKFPHILSSMICAMVFRGIHDELFGSGIGRMPHSVIVKKGQDDVKCLSSLLGNKKYFFGEKPTSYDADVYAFLVLLFHDEAQVANPWVTDIAKECANLVEHTNRMRKLLYPELE